jgi:hypothetical protein
MGLVELMLVLPLVVKVAHWQWHGPWTPILIDICGNVYYALGDVSTAMCYYQALVDMLSKHHLNIYHCKIAIGACRQVVFLHCPPHHLFATKGKFWDCICYNAKFPTVHETLHCIHVICVPQSYNMWFPHELLVVFEWPYLIILGPQIISSKKCIVITFKYCFV